MVGTYTTYLNLYKPVAGEVGWSAALDNNFDLIDAAVNAKAPIASPTFTGVPAAPTAAAGTNTTQIATTAFVKAEIGVSGAAPIANPTFTGVPAAPTAAPGTNTTQLATTAFVKAADDAQAHLPSPTGNAGKEVIVNSGGTGYECAARHAWVILAASDTLRLSSDAEQTYTYAYNGVPVKLLITFFLPPNITIGSVIRVKADIKTSVSGYPAYVHVCADGGLDITGNAVTAGFAMGRVLTSLSYNDEAYNTISADVTVNTAKTITFFAQPYGGNPTSKTIYVRNMRVYSDAGTIDLPDWS